MPFGLLSTGLVIKTLSDIKAQLEAAYRAAFGASINISAKSNFGQNIGITSERLAELWEVIQAVDSAFNPDAAEGAALDRICAITGTIRNPASSSTLTLTAVGTAGTALATGRQASVDVVGTKFETVSAVTITAVTAWAISTSYGFGALVKNVGNIYTCTVAGTSAVSGGPTGSGSVIVDNMVTWRFLGAGDGAVRVTAAAVETGPKIAAAYTLINIETPVSGWATVTNEADAVLGENEETDAELRLRREAELLGASASVIGAIRTKLTKLDNVFSVIVFQNDTEAVNADGMPPHSVEALVRGGDDQEIRDALWEAVAGGITYYGNTTGTITDIDNGGQVYTVKFSRPDELEVYVVLNVSKDPNTFPPDGAALIRAAVLAHGASYPCGRDVHAKAIASPCFSVPGVINVTNAFIGLSAAPATETSITVALRQLAIFDTTRVTVNVTDGIP